MAESKEIPAPREALGAVRADPIRAARDVEHLGRASWRSAVESLHAGLRRSGYAAIEHIPTVPHRFALPYEPGNLWAFLTGRGRRLCQQSVAPGLYRKLQRWRRPLLEQQLAFFFLGEPLAEASAAELLNQTSGAPPLDNLMRESIVTPADQPGCVVCRLRFVPTGELLIVTDRDDRSIPDFVYMGRDSLVFAERLRRSLHGRRFARALDLCCGTGVQGLTASDFADRVEGTDINPRAAAFANLNAWLAGLDGRCTFAQGDLAAAVDGPIDLIVANPPYVYLPESERTINRDGFGGDLGLEIAGRILSELDRLLADGGEAHIVCDSPVIAGQSSLEQLIRRLLSGQRLGAVMTEVRYSVYRQYAAFHRTRGISHVIYYHVQISRGLTGVNVRRLPFGSRLAQSAYCKLVEPIYART